MSQAIAIALLGQPNSGKTVEKYVIINYKTLDF